ncbi:phage major capsid protein [Streptomyces sp. NPDC095613]|uniref:phage major capsid family protein n=1 Tax=Streptomyces sp. NPDC095613 TaxID=3155540 RepID=UPI00331D88FB
MTLNTATLTNAFAAREEATGKLRAHMTTWSGKTMTPTAKAIEERLLADIARHDSAVASEVRSGAVIEIQRSSGVVMYAPTDGYQHRDLERAKILGVELGKVGNSAWSQRSADSIEDTHSYEPVDVMLSTAPNGSKLLSRVNAFPFTKTRGFIPVAPVVNAELQPRNEPVVDASTGVLIGTFDTVKPAAYVVVDRDELQDYPFAESTINAALLGAVGRAADKVIVAGGTDGDVTVPGLLDEGTSTAGTVSGGVGVDDVLNAVGRVEDASGTASLMLMSPSAKAAFIARAASTYGANILDRLPEIVSIPGAFSDGSAVVADMAQVAIALRQNLELFKSIDEPTLWGVDKVALAARARLSGVVVPSAAFVQIVTPGA